MNAVVTKMTNHLSHQIYEDDTKKSNPVPPLHYEVLNNNFYSNLRNQLNTNTLSTLTTLSESLPSPKYYGIFLNEAHYANTLSITLRSTQETRKRGAFIHKMVLPSLRARDHLLDVGPGDGQIISWIGNQFSTVTLVDNNHDILKNLNNTKTILKKRILLHKIESCIESLELPENYFDFVLLSQLLYYISMPLWMPVIQSVYNSLKPGGAICLVLSGDKYGKAELIKNYGGKPPEIDQLASKCIVNFGQNNVKLYVSPDIFVSNSITVMKHICGLFLNDAKVYAKENDLVEYINHHIFQHEKLYSLTTQQKYIVINKMDT